MNIHMGQTENNMAIPYAGVNQKLKDADTPWESKVLLARFAWTSPRCFLPNKEQVLIDWAANSLANSHKFSVPDHVIPGLWQFFHDALQSRRILEMGSRAESLSLRPSIFPVILKTLNLEDANVQVAIESCLSLLGIPSLGNVITATLDHQVQFLSAVVNLFNALLVASDVEVPDKLNALVVEAFRCFASLQRLQPNPRKVFKVVYQTLLGPVLTLHHTILSFGAGGLYADTLKCIQDLIANGLFNRDMLEGHTLYLRSVPGQVNAVEKQREMRLVQEDIASLWKNLADKSKNKDEVDRTCYLACMPVLFKAFLSVQKHPKDVSFALFQQLCCVMGIRPHDGKATSEGAHASPLEEQPPEEAMDCEDGSGESDVKDSSPNWEHWLPAVDQLLRLVADKQIYEVAVDNTSGKSQFRLLCFLAGRLVEHADSSTPVWYNCLSTLLDMNHLVLEGLLTQIMKEALYQTAESSLAQCAQQERCIFLEKLLRTYTKLRQFDRVVTCMMQACLTSNADATLLSFTAEFTSCFSESVQSLPPGLTLDIWKQFLSEIHLKYLPQITTMTSPPPRKRIKGGHPRSEVVKLGAIVATFDLFLQGMQLVDTGLTVPSLRRVGELMQDMKEGILRPLLCYCCSEDKPPAALVCCTLRLCHVWGDLHLLLCQYTKYTDRVSFPSIDESGFDDFFTHLYLTSGEWAHISEVFAGDHDISLMQVRLAVQQAKALLLHGDTQSAPVRKSLVALATEVCNKVTENLVPRKSFLVVLLGNLQLLMPFLPSQQLANLSRLLCETIARSSAESFADDSLQHEQKPQQNVPVGQAGDLEVCRICEEFVRSEFCTESRQLQTALVSSVLGQVSKVIGSRKMDTASGDILQRLSEAGLIPNEEAGTKTGGLDGIVTECNDILSSGTKLEKSTSFQDSMELVASIRGALKILKFLPLQHLLPSNKVRCMLGLVLVDKCLTTIMHLRKAEDGHQLSALLLCRQLEAAILKGAGSMKAEFLSGLDAWKILAGMTSSAVDPNRKGFTKGTAVPEVESDLSDVTEDMLSYWLKRLRQLPNQEASFKHYIHMVETKLVQLRKRLGQSKTPHHLMSSSLPLLTVSTTLLTSLLASKGLPGPAGSQPAGDLTKPILENLSGVMGLTQAASAHPPLLNWLVKAGAILVKFASRAANLNSEDVRPVSASSGELDINESDTQEARVTAVAVNKERWKDTLNPVLQEVCAYFGLSGSSQSSPVIGACLLYLQSCCNYVSQCCEASTIGMATGEMWQALLSLMGTSGAWTENMKKDFQSTLTRITETMDLVQLRVLLDDLLHDTSPSSENEENPMQLDGALVAWQLLPGCLVSEETRGALADIVPEVMLRLLGVLQDAVSDWTRGGAVAVSVLQSVSSIIGQGETLVSADKAMQAQHFCLMVPIATVTTSEFPLVFGTMCQIMRCLLIGYPRTVMGTLASYFACLQHLLKAVMHRGMQRRAVADQLSDHDLYLCAENMERLLTMLATYKNDVNKLAVFLVADYITELQKGTLLPLFKKALVAGVYNLLDACDERSLDYLNASLPHNLREIFKTFYSDFQKYHRYSGRV